MDDLSLKLRRTQPEAVYEAVITKDGKLTLPEGCFTDKTGDAFVVTKSFEEEVIWIFPMDSYDIVRTNLSKMNSIDPKVRMIRRRIIAEAVPVETDEKRQIELLSEFMAILGFDMDQDDSNTGLPVMLLMYPDKIEVASIKAYKTIVEELKKQQEE